MILERLSDHHIILPGGLMATLDQNFVRCRSHLLLEILAILFI